ALEEGTYAEWLYSLLAPRVARIVVCDPARTPDAGGGRKSDRLDARKLAEWLRLARAVLCRRCRSSRGRPSGMQRTPREACRTPSPSRSCGRSWWEPTSLSFCRLWTSLCLLPFCQEPCCRPVSTNRNQALLTRRTSSGEIDAANSRVEIISSQTLPRAGAPPAP